MPDGTYLGFDFGYRRIGVAVGQLLTCSASPLATLLAKQGVPDWGLILKLIHQWRPLGLVVGFPSCIDGSEQYTSKASKKFAEQLRKMFALPVHMVDERLTTKEARDHLFAHGGYRNIQKADVDSVAACIILEQWLSTIK